MAQRWLRLLFAATLFLVSAPTDVAAQPTARTTAPRAKARAKPMPKSVRLGVMTIDRFRDSRVNPSLIAKSIFTPLSSGTFPGRVANMNRSTKLPKRFVIGDGGHTRSFISVDRSEGSPLKKELATIINRIPKRSDGTHDPEVAIEFLRANVNNLIRWTKGSSANDGRAEFEWDLALHVDASAHTAMNNVAFDDVGGAPRDAGQDFNVVPFENYIRKGEGYCIQKAVLASLVLAEMKVPHRLVNGAVLTGPGRSTGHSWLELPDGRVFDPAWGTVSPRGPPSQHVERAYSFAGSERMENSYYPVLIANDGPTATP